MSAFDVDVDVDAKERLGVVLELTWTVEDSSTRCPLTKVRLVLNADAAQMLSSMLASRAEQLRRTIA